MRKLAFALIALLAVASPAAAQSWIYSSAAERVIENLLLRGPVRCCKITDIYGASGTPHWTWPTSDGSNGQVLTTNGSGVLSFSTVSTISGSGTATHLARWTAATALGDATVTETSGALAGITTLGMSGQLTSTLASGTAPFVVASTTQVANLNASSLGGATFAAPGAIGGTTPAAGLFTTLGIGTGTTAPVTELQVVSTSTSSPRGSMSAQYSTGTDGARFHMRKARGTFASPTVIVSGDILGRLVASGYDGTNYLEMAGITIGTEGTIASTRVPTNIIFQTATDAAPSVLTTRLTIDSAGLATFTGPLLVNRAGLATAATFARSDSGTDKIDISANDSGGSPRIRGQNSGTFFLESTTDLAFQAGAAVRLTLASTGANTLAAAANTVPLTISGYSLTGSNASSLLSASGTLNTSGVADVFKLAVTDTAHGAGTNLVAVYAGASATTLEFAVATDGKLKMGSILFANLGTPVVSNMVYCSDCDAPAAGVMATCTSAGTKTGAWAFRVNTTPVWGCIGI